MIRNVFLRHMSPNIGLPGSSRLGNNLCTINAMSNLSLSGCFCPFAAAHLHQPRASTGESKYLFLSREYRATSNYMIRESLRICIHIDLGNRKATVLTRSSITDRMCSETSFEPEFDGLPENTWYIGISDVTKSFVYYMFFSVPQHKKCRRCTLLS